MEEHGRNAEISIKFSEFEFPPMQDVLIVGKNAPIGPEAARKVVDMLSPDQYDIIRIEEGPVEAIVVRKTLLKMVPQEKLIPAILEEGSKITSETSIVKAKLDINIIVKRMIEL
ncbi:MAG: hypothetical protein ACYCX4_12210 [Bacillota bacterium]